MKKTKTFIHTTKIQKEVDTVWTNM